MLPVFSNNSQAIFAAPLSSFLSRIIYSPFYHFAKGKENLYKREFTVRKRARKNVSPTKYCEADSSFKNEARRKQDKKGAAFPTGVYCA